MIDAADDAVGDSLVRGVLVGCRRRECPSTLSNGHLPVSSLATPGKRPSVPENLVSSNPTVSIGSRPSS